MQNTFRARLARALFHLGALVYPPLIYGGEVANWRVRGRLLRVEISRLPEDTCPESQGRLKCKSELETPHV